MSICFISSFYNPADFQKPIKNCERFLSETIGNTIPSNDFYFCQVISKECKFIKKVPNNYLELHSESVLWHKERCLNLLIKKFSLYDKYKYICWLDTDIIFDKPVIIPDNFDYDVFQPYLTSIRQSDSSGISSKKFTCWANNRDGDKGLSWGIKSSLLKKIGGFFDFGIVGGSDTFFVNRMSGITFSIGCPEFDKELDKYFKNNHISSDKIGYLNNTVTHLYHGSRENRAYWKRMEILKNRKFSPLDDMIVEKSGLYRLRNKDFELEVKRYFINREEDE